jgi:hypothetical protein
LKFAGHIVKEVESIGKDALEIKTPFNELELLNLNKDFIFDGMTNLKNIVVLNHDDPTEIENSKNSREQSLPGKPASYFY